MTIKIKRFFPFMLFLSYVFVAVVFTYAGYRWAFTPPVPPKIVKVIEYKTVYKEKIVTPEQFKKCYLSPIKIAVKIEDDVMNIQAGDACKSTAMDVKLECPEKPDFKGKLIAGTIGALLGSIATALLVIAL